MSKVVAEVELHTQPQKDLLSDIKKFLGKRQVLYIISFISFFALWDLGVVSGLIGQYMPRPIEVVKELGKLAVEPLSGKTLFGHLWFSFRRIIIGFSIAVVIGVPVGVLMASSRYANAIIKPIFEIFKPMPPIAWISIAILWFGIGETSKVFIIIIGAIVPLIINSFNGIRLVDEELYDVIRMLGGSRQDEIKYVMFPASFPAIFAGMQISLSLAWGTVLAAELVGAREGMGFIIVMGMNIANSAMIIGGMVMIAVMAFAISYSISYMERWVCPWKRDINV